MKKIMKVRLAVFLSILMILPTIVTVLPMASMEVLAAGNEISLSWCWDTYNHKSIEVEKGQEFYIGDYANIYIYGNTYWSGNASLTKATYTSSKKSVATVNNKGYFIAKKTGTTTITVKYKNKKISAQVKVVPAGTFETSDTISDLKKKAEVIAKKIPSKVSTRNGFELYRLKSEYQAFVNDSTEINARGFLKEEVVESSSYSYYKETAQLAVPQAGRYLTLDALLFDYGFHNNPTGTTGAKLLKIKSVSAKPNVITIKVKNKIDSVQILAAQILSGEMQSGNTKANIKIWVYDKQTRKLYMCKSELKKGSTTLKLIPYTYSSSKSDYVPTKLKKGRTYVLENKNYWTKGKTVKVK